jgi:hypothetical protein
LERITALEAGGSSASIVGQNGVRVDGSLAAGLVRVLLEGSAAPSTYYGMDASGAFGFYPRTLATLTDVDLTGLVNGNALVWNSGTARFVPGTAGSGARPSRITETGDVRITASRDIRIAS